MDYSIKTAIETILSYADINDDEKYFCEEVKELVDFIKNQNIKKSYIKNEEALSNIVYNFVIEWAVWGLVMQSEKMDQNESEIYSGFCIQISNTLLSIYKLTKDGLDYQAMCLVRVLLEMSIVFLAILLDDNVKESYFKTKDLANEREIWKKELRYNKVLKVVLKYCKENAGAVFKESPEAEKIYAEMYTELSRYEHNSYLNVFLFNYAAIEDDRLAFNFHGNKVTRIKFVFNEVLKVMVFAKTLFFRVLIEKNILLEIDINDNDFLNELQEHAILLHYLIESLTYQYWEDKENEKD